MPYELHTNWYGPMHILSVKTEALLVVLETIDFEM